MFDFSSALEALEQGASDQSIGSIICLLLGSLCLPKYQVQLDGRVSSE